MSWVLNLAVAAVAWEILLQVAVRAFRREFKWLVNEADECPSLAGPGLEKFLGNGFDPELGWSRKPNTSGQEMGRSAPVTFTIDSQGSRRSVREFAAGPQVAAFGDSYVFCRQVEDSETWETYLGEKLGSPVLNFGVGNYGIDQAILRYERTELPASVKTVLLGFVPETICRVQSYWKHYLEFGNTFAFKPRFALAGEGLSLLPNLVRSRADFARVPELLPELQKSDRFYREKFRRVQFRFPYLLSFFRAPERNAALLARLLRRTLLRFFGKSTSAVENAPFELIMEGNIRHAHRLYRDEESRRLMRAIFVRFAESARRRGHEPVVLVLPQMIDISISGEEKRAYVEFFCELERELRVIDFTAEISRQGDLQAVYTEDLYGGHFSPLGNRLVAEYLHGRL